MPKVRVGSLTVRHTTAYEQTDGGVYRPRLFEGNGLSDYTHRRAALKMGCDLHQRGSLVSVEGIWHTPPTATWDQLCAQDHRDACKALDKTEAGEKARDLLFSVLTPWQRFTAQAYGFVDLWLYHKQKIEEAIEEGKTPHISSILFRFKRGHPNGNIRMGFPEEGPDHFAYTCCLHPLTPYPNDDILLAQMMLLLTDPDTFLKDGNWHDLWGSSIQFSGMFGTKPKPPKLILPTDRFQVVLPSGA